MQSWKNVLDNVDGTMNKPAGLGKSLLVAEAFGGRVIVKETSAADVRQMTHSGTAALHLLRESQVPVWLHAPPARRSGRVVAVVNFSEGSEGEKMNERVVLAAERLSLLEPAELHIVCVADHARDRLYESILSPAQYRRYLAKDRDDLRRSLADMVTRLGPRAVPHLVEGNAVDELEKIVLELDADAVTMGRHDSDQLAGMAGLHVAERLFCRIDRSVLLVTPDAGTTRSRVDAPDGAHRVVDVACADPEEVLGSVCG
jgi:nucleotide-binding universal stress UspA family protein